MFCAIASLILLTETGIIKALPSSNSHLVLFKRTFDQEMSELPKSPCHQQGSRSPVMQLRGFGFVRTKNSSDTGKNYFDENLKPGKDEKNDDWRDDTKSLGSDSLWSTEKSEPSSTDLWNSVQTTSVLSATSTTDSSPPPAAQTQPPEPPTVITSSFGEECLSRHNQLRSAENVPALQWDDNVAIFAQQWANKLAGAGVLEHSSIGFGENLYVTFGGDKSCRAAVDAWYSEKRFYRPGSPVGEGDFGSYGHYTQV
jgi:hypothetical protein